MLIKDCRYFLEHIVLYFFLVRNSRAVTEIELSDWSPRSPYYTVQTSHVFASKQAEE